ncbi:hypothetical protein T06_10400 [Trichinella sp. T6]|nr:hypothetical protein T06_10400 [Trichinella sp. T6]
MKFRGGMPFMVVFLQYLKKYAMNENETNLIHCHDSETNATKEWHVGNIIPLFKVINQKHASIDRIAFIFLLFKVVDQSLIKG